MKTPDASHVRHIDKSIAIPTGADFKEWSQTVIVMDKYADVNWSFSELIAVAEKDPKAMRYVTWLIGTYATRPVKDPENQAEDFGTFARACGLDTKRRPSRSLCDFSGDLSDCMAPAIFYLQALPTAICIYCCDVKQRISLVSDSVWVTSVVLIRFGFPLNLT